MHCIDGITAASVRLTVLQHRFQQDGLVAAARFDGAESLDLLAEELGFDWSNPATG